MTVSSYNIEQYHEDVYDTRKLMVQLYKGLMYQIITPSNMHNATWAQNNKSSLTLRRHCNFGPWYG